MPSSVRNKKLLFFVDDFGLQISGYHHVRVFWSGEILVAYLGKEIGRVFSVMVKMIRIGCWEIKKLLLRDDPEQE